MMTETEDQILETWRIHNRINLFMIEHIPDEALKATMSTRRGRDIARQLAHVHNVRCWRLKSFARKAAMKLTVFEKNESPLKKDLLAAFVQSGDVMEKYMQHCIAKGGAVSNFKLGVVPMLGYYISHETHHRGHIYLTMKLCGFNLSDELKWGIWEWKKR